MLSPKAMLGPKATPVGKGGLPPLIELNPTSAGQARLPEVEHCLPDYNTFLTEQYLPDSSSDAFRTEHYLPD